MPAVSCPVTGCTYRTDDLDAAIVAALITAHSATAHIPGHATAAKVERVKRPTISAAGTTEDWSYFESRWADYIAATKIDGAEKTIQLLECCDERPHTLQLRCLTQGIQVLDFLIVWN